jgi:hypothetical protein
MHHWRAAFDKQQGDDPPTIVTVEVQTPFDYAEALAHYDVPTLAALLVGRLGKRMDAIQDLLSGVTEGGGSRPCVAPLQPSKTPAVFAKPEKRLPRVAIIGPLPGQMRDIQQQVEDAGLAVALRFVNKEASNTNLPTSCDYVIVTRHSRHKWWDAARQQLENGRVFFVDGGINQVVQKLRDICSRQ